MPILLLIYFSFCGIFISKCLFVKEFLICIVISSSSFNKVKLFYEINLFRELNISSMFSNKKIIYQFSLILHNFDI